MGAFNFKKFLEKTFLEEDTTTGTENAPTAEEMQTFEATIASGGNSEDIKAMAQGIIAESQMDSDNDEFPDISNVQNALDTAGSGDNKELILRILVNYGGFDPVALKQDGIKRRQAILDAIQRIQQQDAALKQAKDAEDQEIAQAESAAETACTDAINAANNACTQAIEEEKRRSAEIIAGIRQKAEDDAAAAKQLREDTLAELATRRADNDTARTQSAALAVETSTQGNLVISKIDEWLGYLD